MRMHCEQECCSLRTIVSETWYPKQFRTAIYSLGLRRGDCGGCFKARSQDAFAHRANRSPAALGGASGARGKLCGGGDRGGARRRGAGRATERVRLSRGTARHAARSLVSFGLGGVHRAGRPGRSKPSPDRMPESRPTCG